MNTALFKNNGHNKYPVSTDTLDFIQEQIKLIYNLSDLYGKNFIVRHQTATTDGIIVIQGEVMPLKAGTTEDYLVIRENNITVTAGGIDFNNARTIRYAEYTSVQEGDCYNATDWTLMKTMEELQEELRIAKLHHAPKRSVQHIFGNVDCDSLEYGWVPVGFYRIPVSFTGAPDPVFNAERTKWIARYGVDKVSFSTWYGGGTAYLRINTVIIDNETISIPTIEGQFIVHAGHKYLLGDTGGSDGITLTASQSGLPAHNHSGAKAYTGTIERKGINVSASYDVLTGLNPGNMVVNNSVAQGASAAHENRPPYFALNMIMKVI